MRGKQAEKGTVLVFVALMLPFLILFSGAAIDVGRAYLHKSSMQNAADAAALAGAETLTGEKARLITVSNVPVIGQSVLSESSTKADAGADRFLAMDTGGKWQTSGSNIATELRKEINLKRNSPILKNRAVNYYYRVELSDAIDFQFASMFLPQALLPSDWKVKVEAWAMAHNNPLAGIDLMTQLHEVEDAYLFSTFQDLQAYYKGKSYSYVKEISFTNKGPAYKGDGTKSEIFDMDGTASINNNMRSLLINFKPDFTSSQQLTDNWDLDTIAAMKPDEARQYIYSLNMQLTNWRILDSAGNELEVSEGGYSLWGKFYDKLKNLFGEVIAKQLLYAPIASIINVVQPYEVRDVEHLSADDISYDVYTDEPNKLDPLFVRIESEEYNTPGGKGWVTNTTRDISINIKADNTVKNQFNDKYLYRPILFFYDGPVGENNERGTERKSRMVTFNLEEDFRGILYAPNSPVYVKGNGHKFYGMIIAQSIVDEAGNILDMPSVQNANTDAALQSFYTQIGLSDAQYDDFGAVRLTVYNNPKKDVVYLTSRAHITI